MKRNEVSQFNALQNQRNINTQLVWKPRRQPSRPWTLTTWWWPHNGTGPY